MIKDQQYKIDGQLSEFFVKYTQTHCPIIGWQDIDFTEKKEYWVSVMCNLVSDSSTNQPRDAWSLGRANFEVIWVV